MGAHNRLRPDPERARAGEAAGPEQGCTRAGSNPGPGRVRAGQNPAPAPCPATARWGTTPSPGLPGGSGWRARTRSDSEVAGAGEPVVGPALVLPPLRILQVTAAD